MEPALTTWRLPGQSGLKLVIRFTASDATGYHEAPRPYAWDAPAPIFSSETECIRWVFEQITRNELHELQEFFRLDGEQVFDPHTTTLHMELRWP